MFVVVLNDPRELSLPADYSIIDVKRAPETRWAGVTRHHQVGPRYGLMLLAIKRMSAR